MTLQEQINRLCPKGFKPNYTYLASLLKNKKGESITVQTLFQWRFEDIRERKMKELDIITNYLEGKNEMS